MLEERLGIAHKQNGRDRNQHTNKAHTEAMSRKEERSSGAANKGEYLQYVFWTRQLSRRKMEQICGLLWWRVVFVAPFLLYTSGQFALFVPF